MASKNLSLGGFGFERQGDQIELRSPEGRTVTSLKGFLAGIRHLLIMELDLEGEAELDGGLVVRVEGEVVKLRLGRYTEHRRTSEVSEVFQRLAREMAGGD